MSDERCYKETEWGALEEKCKRYDSHIQEGECPGGHRDRLAKLEVQTDVQMKMITEVSQKVFLYSLIGGLVGGLLGKVSPSFFEGLAKLFIR